MAFWEFFSACASFLTESFRIEHSCFCCQTELLRYERTVTTPELFFIALLRRRKQKRLPLKNQWEPQPFDLLGFDFDYLLMSIPKYDFSIPNIAVKKFTKYIAKVMASPSGRFDSVDLPGSVFIIA